MESIDQKSDPTARTGDSVLACARRLSKVVTAIYDDNLRSFGISATQFAFLMTIGRVSVTRAEIARLHHLSKSTLTRDLKTVPSAGWIQEVREDANGRSRPLALTTAGKELVLNAQQAWLMAQTQAVALLGTDTMNALTSITDYINP